MEERRKCRSCRAEDDEVKAVAVTVRVGDLAWILGTAGERGGKRTGGQDLAVRERARARSDGRRTRRRERGGSVRAGKMARGCVERKGFSPRNPSL